MQVKHIYTYILWTGIKDNENFPKKGKQEKLQKANNGNLSRYETRLTLPLKQILFVLVLGLDRKN